MEILRRRINSFVLILISLLLILFIYLVVPVYPRINYKIHFNNDYVNGEMRIVESDYYKKCVNENKSAIFIWLSQSGNNFFYDIGADVISLNDVSKITISELSIKSNEFVKNVNLIGTSNIKNTAKLKWDNGTTVLYNAFFMRLRSRRLYLRHFFRKQNLEVGKEYPIEIEVKYKINSGMVVSQKLEGYTVEPYINQFMGKDWLHFLSGY